MTLTFEKVRTYCKDDPDLNILLDGDYQSTEEQIELAMDFAAGDYNALGPFSGYTVGTFPNDSVLLYGTLHHLSNMEAERQLRNQIDFTAQGISANIDNKYPQYSSLASHYFSLFMEHGARLKQSMNVEDAWGEIHSPYRFILDYEYRK